jgi:hypothetical protein
MRTGRIASLIVGILVGLVGLAVVVGGIVLLWADQTQRTAEGFFETSRATLSTESYALTSDEIDLGSQPGDWFPSGRLAEIRLEVESDPDTPVFIGIGPQSDVDDYLDGVAHSEVVRFRSDPDDVTYRNISGEDTPAPPGEQDFWAASAEGAGTQVLSFDLEQGRWAVVVMNADASSSVTVEASAAAKTDLLIPVAAALIVGGVILGVIAVVLIVVGVSGRGEQARTAATASDRFGAYPVRIEGELDPSLSRWLWLVKWALALPHYILLGFLWIGFAFLTVVAWFAILFTGRYPKAIFDFNVGVMRWTWRVTYYSYSALGTDQYPPFTLADVDYPARLDVAYPERLSRGLALVKWWLLAIPHYLIVGLFTSGLIWTSTELEGTGDGVLQIGGGLIGILVVIAGVVLTFTGNYPQGLFDLIMGLNRWVYRVLAYATLMRDEYPPFRLDTGGSESEPTPTSPPATG